MIYGYCRISRYGMSIDRQVRNILAIYPDAIIIKETFTGTKIEARPELQKLLKKVKANDKIVCDSVSRLSREEEAGFELYKKLYHSGVSLEFIKEPQINTDTYKQAIEKQLSSIKTGDASADNLVNSIMDAINAYMMDLAEKQVKMAFYVANREVSDLHQRTKEGLITAKINGKRIGTQKGDKLNVKKKAPAKEIIQKHSKTFGGTLDNAECAKLAGVSLKTFYKYKNELIEEASEN
ncbi:MAG: recombinase family protein [Clostridia bacterium]|nr:recombinase family protein [Clostridia bacterium]